MRERTCLVLGRLAESLFSYPDRDPLHRRRGVIVRTDRLSQFLFEKGFPAGMRDVVQEQPTRGESVITNTVMHFWEEAHHFYQEAWAPGVDVREELFQKLAEGLLEFSERPRIELVAPVSRELVDIALRELELDGYRWSNGRLVRHEENVYDVPDQEGALVELYRELGLDDLEQVKHDLKLTDDHYSAGKWGDCVKHARDVLEKTLFHVATAWLADKGGLKKERRPFAIRDKLRDNGFLTKKEHAFIAALYGLLSEDGGHPNMATKESARIDRQHALSAVHFVLLRWQARRAGM